jgi:hypothetical protein
METYNWLQRKTEGMVKQLDMSSKYLLQNRQSAAKPLNPMAGYGEGSEIKW